MSERHPTHSEPRLPELEWDAARACRVGRVTLRVRYSETDRIGLVYNAHYLTWFEIGRTEYMRSLGTAYRSVEEHGFQLPLIEASLRLRAPVQYDDLIVVETWISRLRSRAVTFDYRLLHGEAVAAEGRTIHACIRAEDGHSAALPEWLREGLEEGRAR
ncbi:MAG: YbgC/FadM family acyl-CoA thioesterase [Candidatus Eisenbacteria bacterium]|nr:YbgC/FadM family acyl-CoA thioesterase [Candidatus Eisenbacteria bacterium]